MRNIKISYQYDGSSFFGFQRQPQLRTVQGEMEKALFSILRHSVDLVSSGRTDRGVHALEQVSNFMTEQEIPIEKLQYALSRALPEDILLLDCKEVGKDFHARFSAKRRAYLYKMTWKKNPFRHHYESFVKKIEDVEGFQTILKSYLGRHNFQNFRLQDEAYANPWREIYEISVREVEDGLEIEIHANAFLKSQIRIMIGTALQVYFGKVEADRIQKMLEQPEQEFPKHLAGGEGLYLYQIIYEEELI